MTFVTTGLAVAGLCAMAIPILIHLLFRRRRTPIEWAAMRYLLEAWRKHRRRLRLEQWLLLAARCLAVALVGAALAQPMLQHAGALGGGGSRTIYLVIDNGLPSAAMERPDGDGGDDDADTVLRRHANAALAILRSLGPGDRVGLITAARPARGVVMPPSTDLAAVARQIESLRSTQTPTDLPAALNLLKQAIDDLSPDRDQIAAYLWSDFRAGSASLDRPLAEGMLAWDRGPVVLRVSPAAAEALDNVRITRVRPLRSFVVDVPAEGATQINVQLERSGGDLGRALSQVRMHAEGLPAIQPRPVTWNPGQSQAEVDFMVDFAAAVGAAPDGGGAPGAGAIDGTDQVGDRPVALTASIDADALDADNRRFDVVQLRRELRIALVERRGFGGRSGLARLSAGDWIARALAPTDRAPLRLTEVDPAALEDRDLRAVDAAILPRPDLLTDAGWSALRRFADDAGVVIVTPPPDAVIHPWLDQFIAALGLPWQIELQAAESDEGMRLSADPPTSELLRMVLAELPELLRPVIVHRRLVIDAARTTAQRVLDLADGAPLLVASSPRSLTSSTPGAAAPAVTDRNGHQAGAAPEGRGLVVLLATAPDLRWTNLPTQPLMVPLMQEVVRQGVSLVRASRRILVGDRPELGAGRAATRMLAADGAAMALDARGRPIEPIERSGLYTVSDAAGQRVGVIAANIEPAAARLEVQPQAAVSAWLNRSGPWELIDPADPAAGLAVSRAGVPLSAWLLLAALALLIVESALARWFSHAGMVRSARSPLQMLRALFAQPPSTPQGI